MNYYNEFDPYAAQWLRNLIDAGHLPNGEVDSRSIKDVKASELAGFIQCHFFAGLGGWSHALRLARWPENRPVWTGSCPCQPFSAAGAGGGVTDERHLWPTWFNLIRECRPDVIFGEQVEAAINHGWLDLVQSDLEGEGYACGAVGIPAGGVGAPHIRQRLWFVADTNGRVRREGECTQSEVRQGPGRAVPTGVLAEGRKPSQLADTQSVGRRVQHTPHDGSANAPSNTLANANDSVADQRRSDIGELGIAPSAGWRTGGEFERGVEMGGGRSTAQRNTPGNQFDRTDTTDSQLADTSNNGHLATDGLRAPVKPSGEAGAHGVGQSAGSCDVDQLANTQHAKRRAERQIDTDAHGRDGLGGRGDVDQLADTVVGGRASKLNARGGNASISRGEANGQSDCGVDQLADGQCAGLEGHAGDERNKNEPGRVNAQPLGSVAPSSWSDCDWLPCRDGKARPVEPGTFPLAHGVSGRVGRLRAYGNAIVPQVAKTFIEAYLES